ncbi:MAG: efflux RND transporter periplasmic adaptor subunit [Proteobacteria bacterium]|nr:efflux RND transporter periplasmic adaptor subunit [Pseudomonadota bacterium]
MTLNEERLAHVVPPIAGIARTVVARTGDRVAAAGQLLAILSSQTLAQQRSALLSARKRRDLARTVVAREQQLWDAQISAEQDLIQARNGVQEADIEVAGLEQQLSALGISSADTGDLASFELRAPFSGTIIERGISRRAKPSAGMPQPSSSPTSRPCG